MVETTTSATSAQVKVHKGKKKKVTMYNLAACSAEVLLPVCCSLASSESSHSTCLLAGLFISFICM